MDEQRKSPGDELGEIADDVVWYEPADPTPRHVCPCCDFVTLPERGNYLICPVCFWEDDGQDLDALDVPSGPNHGLTIREGRVNFERLGACEEGMLQHVVPVQELQRFEYRPRSMADPGIAPDPRQST